ncbi:hypothetical protein BDR06DRAFT_1003789 [Suillus hirtellus]|nr:hypothetical protein BDR06DRAFT_1003789 [Suillus hirtellus]
MYLVIITPPHSALNDARAQPTSLSEPPRASNMLGTYKLLLNRPPKLLLKHPQRLQAFHAAYLPNRASKRFYRARYSLRNSFSTALQNSFLTAALQNSFSNTLQNSFSNTLQNSFSTALPNSFSTTALPNSFSNALCISRRFTLPYSLTEPLSVSNTPSTPLRSTQLVHSAPPHRTAKRFYHARHSLRNSSNTFHVFRHLIPPCAILLQLTRIVPILLMHAAVDFLLYSTYPHCYM